MIDESSHIPTTRTAGDLIRQSLNFVAAPGIWIASSLGLFVDGARSPGEFSDLSDNLLVPQTFAFSIWFPIFLGILSYGVIQAFRSNGTRAVFRQTGWWVAAGLWGIVAWGLATAFLPTDLVVITASLIFIPSMIALVIAMVKFSRRWNALDAVEQWLVLAPVSLIAGWSSIAVFVGLNGLIWGRVEGLGWSAVGTALSVLALALGWVIAVLRRGAQNRIYAFPVLWGLGFLALRHFGEGGTATLGWAAIGGIFAVILAATIRLNVPIAGYRYAE